LQPCNLATLQLCGLFSAGATLIGSHAFGVLINQLGIRAASYATEDVDVARYEVLAFNEAPDKSFLDMLRESGIPFSEVPELRAHATALPYLSHLLGQTQLATLIAREGCCLVRVPNPERFAVHKLVVSQLRTESNEKTTKDVFQAAVLMAALGEKFPGAITNAIGDLPVSARKYFKIAIVQALRLMGDHPRASKEIRDAVSGS
jgi:hypothetical protein